MHSPKFWISFSFPLFEIGLIVFGRATYEFKLPQSLLGEQCSRSTAPIGRHPNREPALIWHYRINQKYRIQIFRTRPLKQNNLVKLERTSMRQYSRTVHLASMRVLRRRNHQEYTSHLEASNLLFILLLCLLELWRRQSNLMVSIRAPFMKIYD